MLSLMCWMILFFDVLSAWFAGPYIPIRMRSIFPLNLKCAWRILPLGLRLRKWCLPTVLFLVMIPTPDPFGWSQSKVQQATYFLFFLLNLWNALVGSSFVSV